MSVQPQPFDFEAPREFSDQERIFLAAVDQRANGAHGYTSHVSQMVDTFEGSGTFMQKRAALFGDARGEGGYFNEVLSMEAGHTETLNTITALYDTAKLYEADPDVYRELYTQAAQAIDLKLRLSPTPSPVEQRRYSMLAWSLTEQFHTMMFANGEPMLDRQAELYSASIFSANRQLLELSDKHNPDQAMESAQMTERLTQGSLEIADTLLRDRLMDVPHASPESLEPITDAAMNVMYFANRLHAFAQSPYVPAQEHNGRVIPPQQRRVELANRAAQYLDTRNPVFAPEWLAASDDVDTVITQAMITTPEQPKIPHGFRPQNVEEVIVSAIHYDLQFNTKNPHITAATATEALNAGVTALHRVVGDDGRATGFMTDMYLVSAAGNETILSAVWGAQARSALLDSTEAVPQANLTTDRELRRRIQNLAVRRTGRQLSPDPAQSAAQLQAGIARVVDMGEQSVLSLGSNEALFAQMSNTEDGQLLLAALCRGVSFGIDANSAAVNSQVFEQAALAMRDQGNRNTMRGMGHMNRIESGRALEEANVASTSDLVLGALDSVFPRRNEKKATLPSPSTEAHVPPTPPQTAFAGHDSMPVESGPVTEYVDDKGVRRRHVIVDGRTHSVVVEEQYPNA